MVDTYYVDNTVEFRVTSTCSTTGADTIEAIAGGGTIAVGDPLRLNVSGSDWEIFRFTNDLGAGVWQLDRNHGISYPTSGVSIKAERGCRAFSDNCACSGSSGRR